jgi:hypothetical protein
MRHPPDPPASVSDAKADYGPPVSNTALIAGVLAGAARGAAIGTVLVAGICFAAGLVYFGFEVAGQGLRGMTPALVLLTLTLAAAWIGGLSLMVGGVFGGTIGAMIGACFPMRSTAPSPPGSD